MMDPLLIVAISLSALYLLMVGWFFVGWLRLKKHAPPQQPPAKLPFVSVVIPVRNESANIRACLDAVYNQTYPAHLFEVIVVDDFSTDPTIRLARETGKSNLLVLDLQQYLGNTGEYFPNKKKAIALGIKNAQGSLIITTDGDCIAGENWLTAMVTYYQSNSFKLITGPVMIKPARGPLGWFQQLDVLNLGGITGATIRSGFPTMCNGANLIYAKETFLAVEGFKGNHDVPTGDDIFLMQKINSKYPGSIGFAKSYDACVFTQPEKTLAGFVAQRVRWVSKSTGFSSFKVALVLYFAYIFNLLIPISALYLLQPVPFNWLPLAVMGGTKLMVEFVFDVPVTFFFRKMVLLLLLPFIQVFHILYVILIGVLSLTGKYRWKDRMIK